MRFSTVKAPKENVANKEYQASGFIPYKAHWNDNTVVTYDNSLVQVIKVAGFSYETADDEDLESKKNLRNTLFKGMASNDIQLYFHLSRKREKPYADDYASVDMPDGFALYLDQKWVEKHKGKDMYVNEMYITIVKKSPGLAAVTGYEKVLSKFSKKEDTSSYDLAMKESYEILEEATGRVVNSLRDYDPELLGIVKIGDNYYSEVAEFFGTLVNCGEVSKMPLSTLDISKQIITHRLYFGKRSIEVKLHDGSSKYAGMISVKSYSSKTWAGMLDTFLDQEIEFIISQSFQFVNRQAAIGKMQLQQNRMRQAGAKEVTQVEQITIALDMASGGEIDFGLHHFTVMVFAKSEKELEKVLSVITVILSDTDNLSVRERANMEPAFWAQLPSNTNFIARKGTINTLNLAAFNSLHNYPIGKAKGNHWGEAVTVLDTTSSTPYYFNFHVRDVGHTTIIGPTGAGKTVLMNFLCAQAQKFKCRLFFFDKDRGAEIFIRALGGSYTIIDPGQPCGFNPLQLEDSGENRTFLLEWLKLLVSANGENISADDIHLLSAAINGNYKLDQEDRKLSNIAPFLGLGGPGTLAGRLAMWHGKGSHARVFDNPKDVIDFEKSNIFGFEMAELLKDPYSLGPVLAYVFHKINLSLDGTPSMIVLDEAWALIDNPVFAPKIKDWLKVLRKLNTFVIFATQSVEDASKSSISDTLIQQTATQIFLPNLRATDVYRKTFMLSAREFELVKTIDPASRFFLVKQGSSSVIARVDLSGMSDLINVLSGRADTVILLDEVRQEYGDNPEIWIPVFNKKVQELREE